MKATIFRLPETKSTNSYATEMLLKDRPKEGCVIITDYQTQGKGTDANTWESEKEKNLTFSLILYPDFPADQQFVINKAISLGIYDFLRNMLPDYKISIKWPNDLYIGDKKVCGILIQNSVIGNKLDSMVVGIGLNVNQTVFTGNAPNPVSLKMTSGIEYKLEDLLHKLLNSIFERYTNIRSESTQKIETDYKRALYRLMEWHQYLFKDIKVQARINGSNVYGQLELETKEGDTLTCDLKEVKFVI